MKPVSFVYHTDYVTPLPEAHRFPMPKFGKIYERLIIDGVASVDQFYWPTPADRSVLELVHCADYVDAYLSGSIDTKAMRRIGFPWSQALVQRTCTAVGGTILTAKLAIEHGLACNTAGGTHHAYENFGSGYCIFNDLAVAARVVQHEGLAKRILIIDLDVHQGDGTAAIFQEDPTVFTFSIHCGRNFPFRKQQSDLDVPLPEGIDDGIYLKYLQGHLPTLLEQIEPDLVFYDGGVDPHRDDKLGKLALTDNGLYQRDNFALGLCRTKGIPVACVVGGGYLDDIEQLARRHCLMHRAASEVEQSYSAAK